MPTQNQIRESITNQIVEHLRSGKVAPWRKPWNSDRNSGAPCNVVSRKHYRGINPAILDMASMKHGFESKFWGTFKQWKELGGQVMKRPENVPPGKWGTSIVFWRSVEKLQKDVHGEEQDKSYCFMRFYTVFCIDQVLGSHLDYLRVGHGKVEATEIEERFERAEKVIEATKAKIQYGSKACYEPARDLITLPHRHLFSVPEFYQTAFHELTHWSEHPSRLDWRRTEPDNSIALGELVAELGGCFCVNQLGLPNSDDLRNHASYMKSWLRKMENDPKYIFKAAAQAARASDYIMSFSKEPAEETVHV
jgi:antirestriction protein ArdC